MSRTVPALTVLSLAFIFATSASATDIVVTTDSVAPHVAGQCTFIAAFLAASQNVAVDACPAGQANALDRIALPAGATFRFNAEYADDAISTHTALPTIRQGGDIEIDGEGATLLRDHPSSCAESGPALLLPFFQFGPESDGIPLNVTIRDLTFLNGCNSLVGGGAMTFNAAGALLLDRTTFRGNRTYGGSALQIANGDVLIRDSVFSDNAYYPMTAGSPTGGGGAIDALGGSVRIQRSSFLYNDAEPAGGGFVVGAALTMRTGSSDIEIENSTFDGNYGDPTIRVRSISPATLTLLHNTFSDNSTSPGTAVLNKSSTNVSVEMQGNWFTNPDAANCLGIALGVDHAHSVNLASDASCPGFAVVAAGGLRMLTAYAGAVPVRPPLSGSPAIDASPDCASVVTHVPVATDARNVPRPQDGGVHAGYCDIGAVEFVVNHPPVLTAPAALATGGAPVVTLGVAFSITDPDPLPESFQLNASVSHGTLAAATLPDVVCTTPTVTSLACSGPLAPLVATLQAIVYTPDPAFGGTDVLALQVLDSGADDQHPYADAVDVELNVAGGGTLLSTSTSALDFGTVPIGSRSAEQTVNLTNIGSVPLALSDISLLPPASDYDFTHDCPNVLAANAMCTVHVTFAPHVTGDDVAVLKITGSAGNALGYVSLLGICETGDRIFHDGFEGP